MFAQSAALLSSASFLSPSASHALAAFTDISPFWLAVLIGVPLVVLWLAASFVGAKHIPNDRLGVVEVLWSLRGSVTGGRIIAQSGEAGYQARILRGGLHFRL